MRNNKTTLLDKVCNYTSDNMPKFLDEIFNKDFIENVLIQKDQMDINFKDDSFFVGQSDIKAVENKGWDFDSISTHGNSGISLLFTKKFRYYETDDDVEYYFSLDELMEFLDDHNECLETNYKTIDEFNNGEPHRKIEVL